MTDLRQMTAAEVLRWFVSAAEEQSRDLSPRLVLACFNVGLTDTDSIEGIGTGTRAAEVHALGKRGPLDPPLASREINMIAKVGHRVFAEDRDNAEEWWLFAQRLEERRPEWTGGSRSAYLGDDYVRNLIASLLDADRGPHYAVDILDRAAKAGILPNTYGWEVEPHEFSDLAAAGVRDTTQIAEWRRALGERYTPARMLTYASEGIASSVAVAAAEQGIPEFEWAERLAGIPAAWVRASTEHGLGVLHRPEVVARPLVPAELPKGADGPWSLDDLAYLARHGWDGINGQGYGLTSEMYGHGRRSGGTLRLTAEQARRLAASGMTPKDAGRIMAACGQGKWDERNGEPPALDRRITVEGVIRLHEVGVRASHIGHWRWAGCRSVEDILRAVAAGITAQQADDLARTHGRNLGRWAKRTGFASVGELLRAHEKTAKEAS